MPQDKRTSLYSIGREYVKLKDARYIQSTEIGRSGENNEPFLPSPSYGWLPDSTRRLHSLMNLHEIPDGDLEKTFSIWNVRLKKPEEDSR